MKLSTLNSVSALILTSVLASQASHAAGLSITTSCKSLSPDSRTQVELKAVRTVNYDSRTARLDVDYSGTLQWDAETHATQGDFSARLPLDNAPVPNLPNEFAVKSGDEFVGMSHSETPRVRTPFSFTLLHLKLKVSQGFLGMGAQYAVLKMALPNATRGTVSAFGNLYLTNRSGSSVTTPDGGSGVSLICENQINDL